MSKLMVPGLGRPNQTNPRKKSMKFKIVFRFVGSCSLRSERMEEEDSERGSCDMRIRWRRYMNLNWSSSSYGALTSHAAIVVF